MLRRLERHFYSLRRKDLWARRDLNSQELTVRLIYSQLVSPITSLTQIIRLHLRIAYRYSHGGDRFAVCNLK